MREEKLQASNSGRWIFLILPGLIALAYSIWILSLPLFPTTDGPMHLYYAHVMSVLLGNGPSIYRNFYFIKHILPPYSLYYYMLILLMKVASPLLADKLVLCIYFFSFVYGFRYFATAIGPNGNLMTLLATVVILNWPLCMGFVNYCFASSLVFWALGLWWRAAGKDDPVKKTIFVVLVYAVMFTHPLPLLFIFGFCLTDMAVRLFRYRAQPHAAKAGALPANFRQDAAFLLLAMGTMLYVRLYTIHDILRQSDPVKVTIHTISDNASAYVDQFSIDIFRGAGTGMMLYRLAIYVIFFVPLALAGYEMRQRIRGSWSTVHTWVTLTLFMILALPFIPQDFNGGHDVAFRLLVIVWLAVILSGSAFHRQSRVLAGAVICFAIAANVLILSMANARFRPIAEDIARLENSPVTRLHQSGLILDEKDYRKWRPVNYDPYNWAIAHSLRHNEGIIYNSPWLEYEFIPLGAKDTLPLREIGAKSLQGIQDLRKDMEASEARRTFVLSHVDFVTVNHPIDSPAYPADALFKGDVGWVCKDEGWFDLCSHAKTVSFTGAAPLP